MRTLVEILETVSLRERANLLELKGLIKPVLQEIDQKVASQVELNADRTPAYLSALTNFEEGLEDGYNRRHNQPNTTVYYIKGRRVGYKIIDSINKKESVERNSRLHEQWILLLPLLKRELTFPGHQPKTGIQNHYYPVEPLLNEIPTDGELQQTSDGLRIILESYQLTTRRILNGYRVNVPLGAGTIIGTIDMHMKQGIIDLFRGWPAATDYEFAQVLEILDDNKKLLQDGRIAKLYAALQQIHSGDFAVRALAEAYSRVKPR